jgi:hypothetical protein
VVEPHFEPRRKVRKNSCCWPLSHTFWHTVKRKFNICNYVELNLTTVVYVFQWIIRVSITKVNLHLLIRVFRYEVNQVMCFLQNISRSQNKCLEFCDWIKSQPIGVNNLISKRGKNGLNDEGANWIDENFNF